MAWGVRCLSGMNPSEQSDFGGFERQSGSSDHGRLLATKGALRVTSPVFISNLFGSQPGARPQILSVFDGDVRLPAQLEVEGQRFEGDVRVVRASFIGDPARLVADRRYTFLLRGEDAVTVFDATCVSQRGSHVAFTVPAEVRQVGFRESARSPLSPKQPVKLRAAHPRIPGLEIEGVLFDVSSRGLSFVVGTEQGLLPGDKLAGLCVALPEGEIVANATVRSLAPRGADHQVTCGLELSGFVRRRDAGRWQRFVFEQAHPDIGDVGHASGVAWQLLEESRYVEQWTPGPQRDHLRRKFMRCWKAPSRKVGNKLVLRKGGVPVGISAGSLAYPGTWILHHLAVTSGNGESDAVKVTQNANELISGLLRRLRDSAGLEHFVIYAEQGKRWNDRLYRDFSAGYGDAEKLLYTTSKVYRYQREVPVTPTLSESPDLKLVPATPALWSELATHLRATLSPLEIRALGFEGNIDLQAFTRSVAACGYERTRQAYFALVDGKPVAALLAETGDEGVNVFGLLNACRIIWMQPGASDRTDIRARLLAQAVEHYRLLDKKSFVLFDDHADASVPVELGFEAVSPSLCWVAHRDVIPAWTSYLKGLLVRTSSDSVKQPATRVRSSDEASVPARASA